MFSSVTQADLRAQMEQHLLMVEEVLGGARPVRAGAGEAHYPYRGRPGP